VGQLFHGEAGRKTAIPENDEDIEAVSGAVAIELVLQPCLALCTEPAARVEHLSGRGTGEINGLAGREGGKKEGIRE
tara:strand:+ start:331 stop:561 length:231 start_codon:yes stop_codon:yes gene_type:complete